MANRRKFYYIDESGNKKRYIGPVINNHNGTFNGYLFEEEYIDTIVDLKFYPAVEEVVGSVSYMTYVNSDGNEVKYYGLTKTKEDGTRYFAYNTSRQIDLIYKAPEEKTVEYFTYFDKGGNSRIYSGKTPTFEKGTYFGMV